MVAPPLIRLPPTPPFCNEKVALVVSLEEGNLVHVVRSSYNATGCEMKKWYYKKGGLS